MERALINMAVNASEAMPDGGHFVIESHATDDEVVVELSDTGYGMDEETRKRAFEPFYTTKTTGSGLGLASVYGIISQLGGEVAIDSVPGGGTRVRLCLPRVRVGTARTDGDAHDRVVGGNETLLFVEDDTGIRDVSIKALEAAGYRVLSAADAREAKDRFREQGEEIDLVVTDVVMPQESGTALAEQLRARRPGLPALFVTGHLRTERPGDAEHVLPKPYDADELLQAVRAALTSPVPTRPYESSRSR